MTSSPETAAAGLLPSELKTHLWQRIDRRLRQGEVLITNEQFCKAMLRDFRRAVGVAPDRRVKLALLEMIIHVNEKHPETYLSAGIRNAIDAFFKNTGDGAEEAREMIKRMVREGRTAMWLEGMGINVDARALTDRVEQAIIRVVEGKRLRAPQRREIRRRRARSTASMVGVRTTSVEAPPGEAEPSVYGALPTPDEEQERRQQENERAEELAADEVRRAPRNLEAYRQQKLLSEEEVADLRKLYGIDKRLADGEIDEAEANELRSQISEEVRRKLQSRLQEAVGFAVHYLSVFEALRRIPAARDEALRMLIRHKNQVMADEAEDVNLSVVTQTLEEDDELLDELGTLMERKDHEMRMMAANMPPYRHVYSPGQKIGKFTVDPGFVETLRELNRDELSAKLNSEDAEERVRTAADIKCMVALLTTLTNATTPFHREVRRLRIALRMRRIFDGSMDERDGRNRVQQFLRRRLNSLYPDLTRQERAAIEAVGQKIMDGHGSGDDEDQSKRVYRV